MTREQIEAREELTRTFDSDERVVQAMQKAGRTAILDHKKAGNPIAVWRDERVVWIQPEDIAIDGETS